MPMFMVERYLPGVAYDAFADSIARAASAAAELTRQGVPVAYLGSTFVPEEESCFCRFQGRDIEAVREVNRLAGVPLWRVVEAVFVDVEAVRAHARLAGEVGANVEHGQTAFVPDDEVVLHMSEAVESPAEPTNPGLGTA